MYMIFFLGFYNYYLWFVLVKNRNKIIAQKYREIKKLFTPSSETIKI